MSLPVITLKNLEHRGGSHIALFFDYDEALIAHVKKIEGIRWSQSNKCWYIPYRTDFLKFLQDVLSDVRFKNLAGNSIRKPMKPEALKRDNIEIRHNEEDCLLYIKVPFSLSVCSIINDTFMGEFCNSNHL